MFSITKVGNNINSAQVREFVADTVDDINSLPHIKTRGKQSTNVTSNDCVAAGSTCFCIDPPSVYMLGNDDEWHQI
jgi:hypothetical protein